MLFGLHALIKDAQTGVCLPQSSIFISSSLTQQSNVSLGDWRSTCELRSQLLPSWLHHTNHTSINKILKNTPFSLEFDDTAGSKQAHIHQLFLLYLVDLCLIWYHKAGLWLVSREQSLLSINRKGIYEYALKSTGKKLKFLVLICWLDYTSSWKRRWVIFMFHCTLKGHESRGYFSCVSMEISTCCCCCSLDNSRPTW